MRAGASRKWEREWGWRQEGGSQLHSLQSARGLDKLVPNRFLRMLPLTYFLS